MSHKYPLTRKDFEDATRVIQRLIEFRDLENPPTSYMDRSTHLRESIKTLALACDFWAAPTPESQQRQYRQGPQRNHKSQGRQR